MRTLSCCHNLVLPNISISDEVECGCSVAHNSLCQTALKDTTCMVMLSQGAAACELEFHYMGAQFESNEFKVEDNV